MRVNLPVTSVERHIPDGEFVLSRTDLKGVITYVNRTFVEISGYSEAELIGQPHNLIRHPDMPKEGFQDLWDNLKAGNLWTGYVKNRAKNGDYYWVLANVTPIRENDQVTGYLSIRSKPDRATVEQVEQVYRLFREGKAKGLMIRDGKVVKTGWFNGVLGKLDNLSIKSRMSWMMGILALGMVAIGGAGLLGMHKMGESLNSVYTDRVKPLKELKIIADDYAVAIIDATNKANAGVITAEQALKGVGEASTRIRDTWRQYKAESAKTLFGNEAKLTEDADKLLVPANGAIFRLESKLAGMTGHVAGQLNAFDGPLYQTIDPISGKISELVDLQLRASRHEYEAAVSRYELIRNISLFTIALGLAFAAWLWSSSLRAIMRPLNTAMKIFEQIGQGRYDNVIISERNDEMGKLINALKGMQIKLGCDMVQNRRIAGEMARINFALKEVASCVTVSDEDSKLIFVNAAGEKLLSRMTGVAVNLQALKGRSVCQMVSNEDMVEKLKSDRSHPNWAEGEINGLHIRIDSAPVYDDDKHYVGHVTQWLDRTEEVAAERRAEEAFRMSFALKNVETAVTVTDEANNLVFVNSEGERLIQTITGDAGAVAGLMGHGLSGMVSDERLRSLLTKPLTGAETAEGTLNGHVIRLYSAPIADAQGRQVGRLSQWQDRSAEVMAEREISQLVESVARGDFSRRMNEADKEGFFQVIAQGLNRLSEVSERGLNEVAGVLNALANGDLTRRIESDYEGMFAQIKDDANRTVDQLRDIVGAITEATDAIHGAAREIVAGNSDLASRTESQSASLEETAASTEELNSTVKNNDDNAHQANDLAKRATEVAARGGKVVQEVVATMGAITESSTRIAEIISVIDGIAFQTNILALNAAVEAARAGEQGRGFAVVAGEVRSLAQRSAAAAKEIKGLISESVAKVTTGHRLVEAAGQTMNEVVDSIERVSHIMNEITVSSAEQRNGIEQLNLAITNMDEATQQNVALVEEATAAAQAMEDQTENLKQAVSTFRMDGSAADWDGKQDRRGPNRPVNVERLRSTPATPSRSAKPRAAIGAGDTWEEF